MDSQHSLQMFSIHSLTQCLQKHIKENPILRKFNEILTV